MPIRITGMNSGLDTESIITELVKAKSVKKDELVKAQTKLEWKQDAWKELNAKVYSLYSKTLSNMRLESDYTKKTTKVSNDSVASVITGATAVNGVQTLEVKKLATTGYLTGGELKNADGKKADYKASTKLTEMGIAEGSEIQLKVGDSTTNIVVDENLTIDKFITKLKNAGVNASFDEKNQRFFISAQEAGAESDFSLLGVGDNGDDALKALGIWISPAEDMKTREEYLKYCNEVINARGEVSYIAKSAEELSSLVDSQVQERLLKHIENQKALADVNKQIEDALGEYKLEDLPEDIDKQIADLKNKIDTNQFGDDEQAKADAEKKLEELNKKNEVIKNVKPLVEKRDGLTEELDLDKGYIEETVDGVYELCGDALKAKLTSDALGVAKTAEEALNDKDSSVGATRISGQDAVISLNGAVFTSTSNNFEINGLTITAHAETTTAITLTTADDTDGIYDMIKGFLKEYNELINEMDKLYNADSAKGYEPLTDEEKDAMSEKEVEKWEEKIKNSILRKDSTLNSVASAMKQVMSQGITMGNGSKMYLSDFGIGTLGYFSSKDNEKNAYHIDGDPDDTSTMTNADKLKSMIANDPDTVVEFFQKLSKSLYNKIGDMMKKTEYSSSFTLYDDVAMKDEYNDYKSKISKQEQKITDYEDRYYKKFSAMETALAKLQSKESAISGLFNI